MSDTSSQTHLPSFNRKFFDGEERITSIGSGSMGGKAQGLIFAEKMLASEFQSADFPKTEISIPTMAVIRTDVFDAFMKRNHLNEIACSDLTDDRIAHAFQKADLPTEILGDLRALISQVHTPLAIRSSSMLEDALYEPFAGIYGTKMIPNNQHDADTRFRKLTEAIKFVYASTFFRAAKNYAIATEHAIEEEKMAMIIQEVVGKRHNDRFYPEISGVARSYNFYPMSRAKPQDGVVNLALGLGKTIVDGGISWVYSPAYPQIDPPFGSVGELLKRTQTEFWTVNMGKPPAYDPIRETEYLLKTNLVDAETDQTLRFTASTYDAQSGRVSIGVGAPGARIINFAPVLKLKEFALNDVIKALLHACEKAIGAPVEMEFAITFPGDGDPAKSVRFGFLQVRPMVVSTEQVAVSEADLTGENVLAASEKVLGNGTNEAIQDVVFVKPEPFEAKYTQRIALDLEIINRQLAAARRPYLLIGYGRWGSSDPWLGIPVNWGQVSGAKAIVEATLPNMDVELSQGSHFFHNLSSFKVSYFSVNYSGNYQIDWQWLAQQKTVTETQFVRHVELPNPLRIKVDGRSGRGAILKG